MTNQKIPIATVGLGLMGTSIATCLLASGHAVTSLTKEPEREAAVRERVHGFLKELEAEGFLKEDPQLILSRFIVTGDITRLKDYQVVIESIVEDVAEKKLLYRQLETVLAADAIIGSNTSAIPVTLLQKDLQHPERLLGIHWAEPAHITHFMEVICGDQTDIKFAEQIITLAEGWGKEPSLLKKDIRGFITNRIMYAMLREAFHLVNNGYASFEDVDRSLRNDLGYWITFAGPFRFMDLTGIPAYLTVMKDLFPELDNSTTPPDFMEKLVASGAKGVSNAKGFYNYSKESAETWDKRFIEFSYDIRKLAEKYKQPAEEAIAMTK